MDKKKIVVASGNTHKIKEIAAMLPDYEIVGYKQFADFEIEETGKTFYDNALIKAKSVAERLNLPALADDSGLCVDVLNGAPGIYSARYAGDGVDEHNNELLLKNMKGVTDRRAKFVCCMVYYDVNGEILSATGEVKGEILTEKQGENGFGYDPIFYSYELAKPMGKASAEEKNSVSHRHRALTEIIKKIEEYKNK